MELLVGCFVREADARTPHAETRADADARLNYANTIATDTNSRTADALKEFQSKYGLCSLEGGRNARGRRGNNGSSERVPRRMEFLVGCAVQRTHAPSHRRG